MGTIGTSRFAAPLWPKEYGGLSAEAWTQQVIREELARHRLPTFGVNLLGVGLAGPTIISHGTEEQKARYLPTILSGEEIWCQLFSEPGAGSDLASVSTSAVRDGDEWIVNGQKVWTSIAQLSKFGMLLAAHRSRRAEARRPHLFHRRDGLPRHRNPPSPADHRLCRLQRGLLLRRESARAQPSR